MQRVEKQACLRNELVLQYTFLVSSSSYLIPCSPIVLQATPMGNTRRHDNCGSPPGRVSPSSPVLSVLGISERGCLHWDLVSLLIQ